jgi:hypothetical protein
MFADFESNFTDFETNVMIVERFPKTVFNYCMKCF